MIFHKSTSFGHTPLTKQLRNVLFVMPQPDFTGYDSQGLGGNQAPPSATPTYVAPSNTPQSTSTPQSTTPTNVVQNNQPNNNTGGNNQNTNSHINPATGQWDDNYFANLVNSQKSDAQKALDAQQAQIRSNISAAYQPIYDELDRQVAALPQQQTDLTNQVGTLTGQQQNDVNFQKGQDLTSLTNAKADEQVRTKQTLNDLAGNIRNLLQGASFYLGSLGSGDSSATEGASTAIINNADRTRGQVLNTSNQAQNQLDRQAQSVNATATDNLRKIDDWKSNELFNISQWATQQLNDLKSTKANAQSQQGLSIANLIQGTQQQFLQRVQALDDAVTNYKMAVSTWAQDRGVDLQNNLTLMNNGAKYTSTTSPAYQSYLQPTTGPFVPTSSNSVAAPTVGSGGQQPLAGSGTPLQQLINSITGNGGQQNFQPANNTGATNIQNTAF